MIAIIYKAILNQFNKLISLLFDTYCKLAYFEHLVDTTVQA